MADLEIGGRVDRATLRDNVTIWLDTLLLGMRDTLSAYENRTVMPDLMLRNNTERATIKERITVFVGDVNRHKYSSKGSPFYSRGSPFFS